MKYRKKPVVIEAIQFVDEPEQLQKLCDFMNIDTLKISYKCSDEPKLFIDTLEGPMQASVGDYIIKGVKGEFYACKPDVFELTYEKAE